MKMPETTKPAVWGFGVGAVATLILGFTWGGWVTAGTAERQAADRANIAVVAALTPICIAQSKEDPQAQAIIDKMKAASSWSRRDLLPADWATMPGATAPDSDVVKACAEKLGASS